MELIIAGSVRVKKFKVSDNEKNEGKTVRGILEFDGGYDFDAREKQTGEIKFILIEPFKTRIDFLKSIMKEGSTFIASGKLTQKKIKGEPNLLFEIKDYGFGMQGTNSQGNVKKEETKKPEKDFADDEEFPL